MWDQIQANRRRSIILVILMAAILAALGYGIGYVVDPVYAPIGVTAAVALWVLLWVIAAAGGSGLMLSSSGARKITHDDSPRLDNVVEEMSIAAGLPTKPTVYLIDSDAPNAFAVGKPDKAAVAVTTGLLMRLNRDELQGVVAHEIGHIANQDTRFMVLAGVMLGAIVVLADVLWRVAFVAGRGRRRSSSRGGGQAMAYFMLVAVAFAVLAPILARLLYCACSRKREYLADANAAVFTRYPAGLASALEKISGKTWKLQSANRVTAPMYIVNPLQGGRAAVGLFSTHPPTEKRVRVLRSMAGGAGYADYEAAYARTAGGGLIGRRALHDSAPVPMRQASADADQDPLARTREAVDILHRHAGFAFLNCACGLRIKVPSSFRQTQLFCPRCSRRHAVPEARPASGAASQKAAETPDASDAEPLVFQRKPGQWQSVRCACGRTIQVSPSFSAPHIRCRNCRRQIRIEQG